MTFTEWKDYFVNTFLSPMVPATFGGSTDTNPYLGIKNPYLEKSAIPNLYNPVTRGMTTVQEQSHFATPETAQAVASALGGMVAAPSVVSQAGGATSPGQQQVIIPGMAGTQNAGALYKTMADAAKTAYKGPASNLATNAGDNPSSAVYLIGSLAVPYDTWAKFQSTLHTDANTK